MTDYTYYPGTDQPHSLRRSNNVYYFMTDYPGNVVALLNSSRAIASRYTYEPFGTRSLAKGDTLSPLQFQARPYESVSGLYNFRARWYDPGVGRFISEDPIGLAGGINPYVFAGNNPIDGRDPSGLDEEGGLCDPYKGFDGFCAVLPGVVGLGHKPPSSIDAGPDYICRTYGYCGMPSNRMVTGRASGGRKNCGYSCAKIGGTPDAAKSLPIRQRSAQCRTDTFQFGMLLRLDLASEC